MRGVVAAFMLASATPVLAAPSAPDALEPYQMVRSLQLIQDRVAGGDAGAMPMQRRLLEIIDAALRNAPQTVFDDGRNLRAFFVYAMSGANPSTIRVMMSRLELDQEERNLGRGIVSYLKSDFASARDYLQSIDPLSLAPEVGAFTALVKGAVLTAENPAGAMRMFDEARLLGPGTLVEEAALRRTIMLSAKQQDAGRFVRASSQYVRRFLDSPYASQFADAFVAGIVALRESIDLDAVETIISGMSDEQAQTIYLRLARKSALEGYAALLDFAAVRADAEAQQQDPRTLLYASISEVTSDNVAQVMKRLDALDRSRLSANDRELLDAARAVARQVTAGLEAGDGAGEEEEERAPPARRALDASSTPASGDPDSGASDDGTSPTLPDTKQIVVSTREKLDEIDRLLQEDAQ